MKKILLVFFLLTSCTGNLFKDLSSKSNDEDYILLARQYLNAEQYDSAIEILTTKLSTESQQTIVAREILASSYGGKCGLNFIDYTNSLSDQTTGSAFYIMMAPFIGQEVSPSHCRSALDTMELIGPSSARTLNQNAFTSILGMVLIGTALRGYADLAPALGNGIADVDICTGLTDDQIDDVVLGFGFMSKNFSAVGESIIGGSSSTTFDSVISTCTSVAGSSCEIIDPAQITPSLRATVRDLVNTTEYGIGLFATGGDSLLIPAACL